MTAQERVRRAWPEAAAVEYDSELDLDGRNSWAIHNGMRFLGSGPTESAAWQDAALRLATSEREGLTAK